MMNFLTPEWVTREQRALMTDTTRGLFDALGLSPYGRVVLTDAWGYPEPDRRGQSGVGDTIRVKLPTRYEAHG